MFFLKDRKFYFYLESKNKNNFIDAENRFVVARGAQNEDCCMF